MDENADPIAPVELIELGSPTADTNGPFEWGCDIDQLTPPRYYFCIWEWNHEG